MPEVYITNTSSFLPNEPVTNEEIEDYLGLIGKQASKSKKLILRNNGIKERYYALDKTGKSTHSNAEMAALSIKQLLNESGVDPKAVEILSCATSSPDQMMPSHGLMVHGELPEFGNIDVTSPSGNCCSGMHALRYAYLAIKSGENRCAVTSASERLGKIMRHENFEEEVRKLVELKERPVLGFEKDFIRWMLSDGAASFLLQDEKNEKAPSLKVEWIESASYANQEDTCMYMSCDKLPDGSTRSYKEYSPEGLIENSILSIKQDVKLLGEKIVPLSVKKLKEILEKRNLRPEEIDYLLPHMSSFYFRDKIDEELKANNIDIPMDKWFTNLKTKGNVGAGSIYLMVDELLKSGKLKTGEKVLLSVPESARFTYAYCLLTVC